jgi:hypothetical protein
LVGRGLSSTEPPPHAVGTFPRKSFDHGHRRDIAWLPHVGKALGARKANGDIGMLAMQQDFYGAG